MKLSKYNIYNQSLHISLDLNVIIFNNEPHHKQNLSMPYANKQRHPHSLNSAFVVLCLDIIIPILAKFKILHSRYSL